MTTEQIKNRIGNGLIIKAYEMGFKALEDGTIISHKGKTVGSERPDGRIHFGVRDYDSGVSRLVLAHRFIAYQLYGDKLFEKGIVVRHLNDDPSDNRFDNIVLGTKKQNVEDAKRNNVSYNKDKYKGEYGKIYRYYKINGWSKTMKDFNLSYPIMAYIKRTYIPTPLDKFRIWLGR